jgi:hypothetical protein
MLASIGQSRWIFDFTLSRPSDVSSVSADPIQVQFGWSAGACMVEGVNRLVEDELRPTRQSKSLSSLRSRTGTSGLAIAMTTQTT